MRKRIIYGIAYEIETYKFEGFIFKISTLTQISTYTKNKM